jgi:hypothetical protein
MRLTKALIAGSMGGRPPGGAARHKRPVRAKATPLPPQDSVRSHDYEGLLPPGPDAGQPDPEEAIASAERWPGHRSFVHSELLTQGQILEGQLAVAAQEGSTTWLPDKVLAKDRIRRLWPHCVSARARGFTLRAFG